MLRGAGVSWCLATNYLFVLGLFWSRMLGLGGACAVELIGTHSSVKAPFLREA